MPLEIKPKMTKAERSDNNPCSYPHNSVFFVKFQPFNILLVSFLLSSKISQIRFLGRELDNIVTSTDVYEKPKGKYSTWSYFKNSYKQGPVLNKHPGRANTCRSLHQQINCQYNTRVQPLWKALPGPIPAPGSHLSQHKKPAVTYIYSPDPNCIDVVCVNTNKAQQVIRFTSKSLSTKFNLRRH